MRGCALSSSSSSLPSNEFLKDACTLALAMNNWINRYIYGLSINYAVEGVCGKSLLKRIDNCNSEKKDFEYHDRTTFRANLFRKKKDDDVFPFSARRDWSFIQSMKKRRSEEEERAEKWMNISGMKTRRKRELIRAFRHLKRIDRTSEDKANGFSSRSFSSISLCLAIIWLLKLLDASNSMKVFRVYCLPRLKHLFHSFDPRLNNFCILVNELECLICLTLSLVRLENLFQ